MAHLLAKLGKEALKPAKVGAVWRKPLISAKNMARLKKEYLKEGTYVHALGLVRMCHECLLDVMLTLCLLCIVW